MKLQDLVGKTIKSIDNHIDHITIDFWNRPMVKVVDDYPGVKFQEVVQKEVTTTVNEIFDVDDN